MQNLSFTKKMMNKIYKSKVTPILLNLATSNGCDIVISEYDNDSGYITSKKGRSYFTYGTIDLNTDAATEFAKNKRLSSEVVSSIGIKSPAQEIVYYSPKTNFKSYFSEIKKTADSLGFPCIIKPVNGTQGKNVFKVSSSKEMGYVIKSIITTKSDLLIQEYVNGYEIRIVCLDNQIIQAYTRDYAHIMGDGLKSIRELIEDKNAYFQSRDRNTRINIQDEQIGHILKNKKYTFEDIVPVGVRLDLSYGRNLSKGGDYEFTDKKLSTQLVNIATEISRSTGLRLVGLDLFLSDEPGRIQNKDQVTFIEYNASPDMENNFYYDDGYQEVLTLIYEKIFSAIVK